MITIKNGEGQIVGKRLEILGDFACLIDSLIDYFGIVEFQRVVKIVGDSRGVDLFEK